MPDPIEKVSIVLEIPKDLYDEMEFVLQRSGRSWDFAIKEAIKLWLLTINPATGERTPLGLPEPPDIPPCPQCGHPVIVDETPVAPLGFCLVCGEITVSDKKIDEYRKLRYAYEQALQRITTWR